MKDKIIVTWDDIPYDIKELVEIGICTKEEAIKYCEQSKTKSHYYNEPCYRNEPVYATESNMTKKEAEFLFVHQGHWMNEWKLDMLLENGYGLEANDKWNSFIRKLLNEKEITKRQYDNWKDRFKC